jgi:hypothetical protein
LQRTNDSSVIPGAHDCLAATYAGATRGYGAPEGPSNVSADGTSLEDPAINGDGSFSTSAIQTGVVNSFIGTFDSGQNNQNTAPQTPDLYEGWSDGVATADLTFDASTDEAAIQNASGSRRLSARGRRYKWL